MLLGRLDAWARESDSEGPPETKRRRKAAGQVRRERLGSEVLPGQEAGLGVACVGDGLPVYLSKWQVISLSLRGGGCPLSLKEEVSK